ncbi:unnamed protein product [Caenorhabditis auriculariae]|uniref:Protein YIF1 n=1 Tax=Caenorhabditis auriculariae TaxID=2777116 RepID=A0A8S1GUS7_9PELO|nr:unnamed protein product [Caenorhabditis auriculariae]
MSNEWSNDWGSTDQWKTNYSPPQQPQQHHPAPQRTDSYGGDYYSQQQNQGFSATPQPFNENYNNPPSFAPAPQAPAYNQNANFGGFQPQQFMSDPMLMAAQQFGGQFAEQQKEKLSKYLGTFNLKYFFAVDNSYVGKKLFIMFFPFFHRDWSLKYYGSTEPYPAKDDVNAPDLYIPLMSFLTYILVSGFVLGTQGRFSPEVLGILTTNALIWIILENIVIFFSKYVMNISQTLSVWHSVAYSTYKFAGMIFCLLMFIGGGKMFYYGSLVYTSFMLVVFLLRSVSQIILQGPSFPGDQEAKKRKLMLVLFVVVSQPLIMWWLTSSQIAPEKPRMVVGADCRNSEIGVTSYDPDKLGFAEMALKKMTGGSGSNWRRRRGRLRGAVENAKN